ncbi:HXXEE domain-containing protein [Streptomyces sp. NBC_00690]|uniref:HXXEE domain-containing protein n=1 Tax=Streptomyces sp. NBC_00690 TaxID=2975808 RepID=UPI002E2B1820|nr:HXXEE domain-containing protein [Streptomyces sp. NBC_00690]
MAVRTAATWGLFAAWTLHEAEEAAVMARWLRQNLPRLQERFPRVRQETWDRLRDDMTPGRVRTAIGLMGLVMAAAAADGHRTGGRSRLYQAALAGYGWHGLIHLGQSLALRGYTPGVATAPVVVLPFSLWAWRELLRSDVPHDLGRASAAAAVLFPVGLATAHVVAKAVLSKERSGSQHGRIARGSRPR